MLIKYKYIFYGRLFDPLIPTHILRTGERRLSVTLARYLLVMVVKSIYIYNCLT